MGLRFKGISLEDRNSGKRTKSLFQAFWILVKMVADNKCFEDRASS